MRPFFSYYGGKWRVAPKYPPPRHDIIIEPFAGSAGYSVRHSERNVVLCDYDPIIAGVWSYLISASRADILSLPDIHPGESVDDHRSLTGSERHLIGFWLNKGSSAPSKSPSKWMRDPKYASQFWGCEIKKRIANQVGRIKHWRVVHGQYFDIQNTEATWFIDPPYFSAGKHYRHGSKAIDYDDLGCWCMSRLGQSIVCENDGANWLDFSPFMTIKANRSKKSKEVIWTND